MNEIENNILLGAPVTISKLAAELGVAVSTVSCALNNRGRMTDKTRQRIIKKAREYHYTPSQVAQSLTLQKTRMLGVVVPMIGGTVYSKMVRGIEQVAFEHGYNITLCDTDIDLKREQDYMDMLIRRRVEGAIVIPFAKRTVRDSKHLLDAESYGVPLVIMEEELKPDQLTQVMVSTYEAAKQIVNHLIALGHRRIGFFRCGPESSWDINAQKRFKGYRDALVEADLPFAPELVLDAGSICKGEIVLMTEKVEAYLRDPARPTAIFAGFDELAARILPFIYKLGLIIPDDLAIVGFDDTEIASLIHPPLTTMRQPAGQLGRLAAELLLERIKLGLDTPNWPRREYLPCELIIRDSCGAKT